MLGTFFTQGPSLPPDSHCASNLQTTFTTSLGRGEDVPQASYRRGRESFENSLCFKLQELQEKSSRIISKLPSIHSRILRAQGCSRLPAETLALPFAASSAYSNKLKIIRDLQLKIDQLQTNINNPALPHEHMRDIEREINLDFENYYQEIKVVQAQDPPGGQQESEDSFDSKEENEEEIQAQRQMGKNREGQTQTSILSVRKKEEAEVAVVVCIPKIIEVEVPYEVYCPKRTSQQDSKTSSVERGSLPAQSLGSNSGQKSGEGSSIERIINRFNERCYPEQDNLPTQSLGGTQQPYTYRISPVQHDEHEEFHLPLDSYQHCRSERGKSSNGNTPRLKKTDRSQLSSEGQVDHRDDIWNKQELGLNHEHLSLVKEQERASSDHSSDHFPSHQAEERERLLIDLNKKISALTEENLTLTAQLEHERTEKYAQMGQLRIAENRSVEMEIDYLQEMERLDELREENRELNGLLIACKEALFKRETHQRQLQTRVRQLQKDFSAKLQQRENEMHELLKTIHDKSEELQEAARIHEEMKTVLNKKEKQHEIHSAQLDATNHELREELNFYKGKLEELEEADLIRELLEKREDEERQKMQSLQKSLQNKYKSKLQELISQNQRLSQQLEKAAKNPPSVPSDSLSPDLQRQIQQLLSTYNSQLFKKDQQITHLRKLSSDYKQLTEHSTGAQVRAITDIRNVMVGERMDRKDISNDMVQCVYLIDRLLRGIKVFEYTANREKEERAKMAQKVTSLNLFFNRQLEKAEEKNLGLETERQKLKRQLAEISRELKKCTQKMQFYKGKLELPGRTQLCSIFQLENEYLLLQTKKMQGKYEKIKKYSEQLQGQFLNDLIKSGSSFCQHLCRPKQATAYPLNKQQEAFSKKITTLLQEMKDEYNKSLLLPPQESTFGHCPTTSKIQNNRLASAVFTITNKPLPKPLQSKLNPTPAIKALLIPLPDIPKSVSATPAASITLDKLLEKRICTSGKYRERVTVKLLDLAIELNKVSKKLFSIRPCQILVNYSNDQVQIILRREFGNSAEQDESTLIYRAPQVLLGFNQSQASYVWTMGVIIDQIYHQKLFYKKIAQVMSRKNNYFVRNETLKIRSLLEKMMVKNHKERPNLGKVREEIVELFIS